MAVASMVLGICSIVFVLAMPWLGLILGIVAIALSASARRINPNDGKAIAGLVCGIIGVSLAVMYVMACVACANAYHNSLEDLFDFYF